MRVVIGEDLFLLRQGLVSLLTVYGFEVVAAVASAPELLRALLDERPDVGIVVRHSSTEPVSRLTPGNTRCWR